MRTIYEKKFRSEKGGPSWLQRAKVHFYMNWAKERIDEMDAVLAALEARMAQVATDSRAKADQIISNLRKTRDEFKIAVQKQAQAGEAAWEGIRRQLEAAWATFEADVKKYLETMGQGAEQQKAIFQSQVAAQLKAACSCRRKAGALSLLRPRHTPQRPIASVNKVFDFAGTAGWTRTTDLLIHSQAL
jgi:hypothetical protein